LICENDSKVKLTKETIPQLIKCVEVGRSGDLVSVVVNVWLLLVDKRSEVTQLALLRGQENTTHCRYLWSYLVVELLSRCDCDMVWDYNNMSEHSDYPTGDNTHPT
jgi:hypothetical protein